MKGHIINAVCYYISAILWYVSATLPFITGNATPVTTIKPMYIFLGTMFLGLAIFQTVLAVKAKNSNKGEDK